MNPLPKFILFLISFLFILVSIVSISSFFLTPERRVKSAIDSIASAYYKDYFYQSIINSSRYSGDIESTMQKYTRRGFASIPLRQILHYHQTSKADSTNFIESHCDPNYTFVKFYPDPPFSSTDFHIDYTYSCEF